MLSIIHSVYLAFKNIKNRSQDVLFDYTLILPWKIQVTPRTAK